MTAACRLLHQFRALLVGCAALGIACWAFAAPDDAKTLVFSSGAKGNIFTDTTGVLSLRLPESAAGGEVAIRDEAGKLLSTVAVPAAASGSFSVSLPGKGYYALAAVVKLADGSTVKTAATAAVVGPVPPDEIRMQSRLGLWTVQGDPDLVLAAGARWNRRMVSIHTLKESILDPNPPPEKPLFKHTPFDQVGVISFGLPRWIMEPTEKKKSFGNPLTKPVDWDRLRQLVAAWTRAQSENFPDHFEIYNEPEWQWTGGTNAELVRLLATIADGIKEARPQTKVLGPGFSSIRIKDPARLDLETANKLGLFDHLDGLVVHAYVDGTPPEGEFIQRVAELKQFLADIGRPNFPIHITEFGWTSGKGTWQKPVDELTQARYAVRSLTLLAALGVENATFFCLQFKAAPNLGERGFSLVRDDSTPKPSFAAYSNVARWLANVKGLGTWLRLTPTTHLVLFGKTDGTSVAVAWDTAGERVVGLPLETSRREDMTGRSLRNDSADLALSPSPIFLEFAQAQSPTIQMLPRLDIMRGGDDVALSHGSGWIAPAPLKFASGRLSVPASAANGDYLLLTRDDGKWFGQPVRVIPPLEASPPLLDWPAGETHPSLVTIVASHALAPVSARIAVTLDGVRDQFLEPPSIKPGEQRRLVVPLDGLDIGRRYRGRLSVDSRHEGRRDMIDRPLDLTLLAAPSVVRGAAPDWSKIAPVDFSLWDPFGGPIAAEDCSATVQAAHGADGLHLRVVVRDDEHLQTHAGEDIWSQDAIQIGLDPDYQKTWEANDLFGLKGHRVFEYGVAGASDDKTGVLRPMTWRWVSYLDALPVGRPEPRINLKVTREGDLTTYDILFPWTVLGLDRAPAPGAAIGIALSVADADTGKKGRRTLRLFNGVSESKDPEKFGPLWLR